MSIRDTGRWVTRLAVRVIAALLLASAPAQAAAIYNFTFTQAGESGAPDRVVAEGWFETGADAADAGYELITAMTLERVLLGSTYQGPFTAAGFHAGAAYNPLTGAFINHYAGSTYDDLGTTVFNGPGGPYGLTPSTFRQNSDRFDLNGAFLRTTLRITPQEAPAAVPEPTSLLLLGTGLVAGAARLRRRS